MDEEIRSVKPFGYVYTMDEVYFLLSPHPIPKDSWMGDNCYQFLVTPFGITGHGYKNGKYCNIYGYARHIITNCFTIEYRHDMEEILIPEMDEINVDRAERTIEEDDEKDDGFPF